MNQIDFLPSRIKKMRRRRVALKRQGLLLGLCVFGLAMLGYFNHGRIDQARADLAQTQIRRQDVRNQLSMLPGLLAEQAQGQIKIRISQELGSRMDLLAVLAEVTRMLPKDASLTKLDCRTVEVELGGSPQAVSGAPRPVNPRVKQGYRAPTENRARLEITGVAPTGVEVAQFVGQLSSCPLFENVRMVYDDTVEIDNRSRKARNFQVTCLLLR